jgi:glycosyltransferase involved in cell wall biosynthesis
MKDLLLLCPSVPRPSTVGEAARAWRILRHLAGRYRVHLGCFAEEGSDRRAEGFVRQFCHGLHVARPTAEAERRGLLAALLARGPGRHPGLEGWAERLWAERRPPFALALGSEMAPYALMAPEVASRRLVYRAELGRAGAALRWSAQTAELSPLVRWLRAREARALLAGYRGEAACAAHLLGSSAAVERLRELVPSEAERILHLADGIDVEHFSPRHALPDPSPRPSPRGGPTLLLAAEPDGRAPAEAVLWFVALALPLVQASVPGLRVVVAGGAGDPSLAALADLPGVELAPAAADPRPWLRHAAAVAVPQARPARSAVLEAMAMGRPVVASAASLEDLDAVAGRELWRAEGPEEFARATVAALDPAVGPAVGRAARARVQAEHSWERALDRLDWVLEEQAPAPAPAAWPIPTGLRP